jgi:hypothetical protein
LPQAFPARESHQFLHPPLLFLRQLSSRREIERRQERRQRNGRER